MSKRPESLGYRDGCPWPMWVEGLVRIAKQEGISVEEACEQTLIKTRKGPATEVVEPLEEILEWLQTQD